jgi:hypothetical protein
MSPILGARGGLSAKAYGFTSAAAVSLTAYESIATVTVGSGGSSSISFNSIPSTYTHLQIRALSGSNPAGYNSGVRFNSDTGSNYYGHGLAGSGPGSVSSFSLGSQTFVSISFNGITNTQFAGLVVDILDYANTNKNKTIRSLNGRDNNGSGDIYVMSGSWGNTSAINSITIVAPSATFIEYSHFALYGIKGA